MICAVRFPFAVNINMVACGRNRCTRCNLLIAVGTPCIACIARFATGCRFSIAYFGMLVIRSIYFAVLSTAYRTNRLSNTGSLAAAVLSFVDQIAAANGLAVFPVVGLIGTPDRCRIVCGLSNNRSGIKLCVTVAAIGIAGITFLITSSFFLIFDICSAFMVRSVNQCHLLKLQL